MNKAFEGIEHDVLTGNLKCSSLPLFIIIIIEYILRNGLNSVKFNEATFSPLKAEKGVRQGENALTWLSNF